MSEDKIYYSAPTQSTNIAVSEEIFPPVPSWVWYLIAFVAGVFVWEWLRRD